MQCTFKNIILLFIFFFSLNGYTQNKSSFWIKSDTLNKNRSNTIYISEAAITSAVLVGLNEAWYKDYPRSSFQFKNDNRDWLQMDKYGHAFSTYQMGRLSMEALDWAGESQKNQLLYGATLGFGFLTAVEVFDGFSEEWGFSTGDMVANAAGTSLLIGQELLWKEQRISLKYSFHKTSYAKIRPNVLGATALEQSIKDYNGMTFWLSGNIWSFNKESKFPKWLNIAFGYGANGLLYGNENDAILNFSKSNRQRQFYLSLDVDLTKIETRSKFLKTLFSTLNFIKIPAPTIEFNTKNNTKFYWLYF